MDPVLHYIISPERLPFALLGILLTTLGGFGLGAYIRRFNPFFWFVLDGMLSVPIDRLNRPNRGVSDLILRGFLLTSFAGGIGLLIGIVFQHLSDLYPLAGVMIIIGLLPVFGSGALWKIMLNLHKGLKYNQKMPDGLYYSLSLSTRLNLSGADDFTITRLGITTLVRSFSRSIVAPVFWYLIGGLPAAYLYSAVAYMKWRTGKEGYSKGFGVFAEITEKIMGIIPAYFSAMLFVIASFFTPTVSFVRALKGFLTAKDKQHCPYSQGGRPVSVIVWALNVSLGGSVVDYDGLNLKMQWVGPPGSTAQLHSGHLKRTVYLLAVSLLLLVMILLLMIQADTTAINDMINTNTLPDPFG